MLADVFYKLGIFKAKVNRHSTISTFMRHVGKEGTYLNIIHRSDIFLHGHNILFLKCVQCLLKLTCLLWGFGNRTDQKRLKKCIFIMPIESANYKS